MILFTLIDSILEAKDPQKDGWMDAQNIVMAK